ncbi:LRR domain containing protein [Trema orientale]|uniref:LRR domain containing protein n=1 Tax=Trema orientale TaxID=63057 RepID=A0A2P5EQU3_TREOI|nr:LRR domain containing protein [Trema orientale]
MDTPLLNYLLTLLFFSTFLHPSLSADQLCNPRDKRVLLRIKRAFNNPKVLASWDPHTDCCQWNCVTCHHETHRINSLIVSGGLPGHITPHIGDLPYLETLVLLKHNDMVGPIPRAITKLKRLTSLTVSWTNISGPVPNFLSQLRSLTSLDLSFNNLTGPIPGSLALLPNLTSLHLDRNKLTGPIPASFGQFRGSDFYLYLSHNRLTGQIPSSLGTKRDFSHVDLSRNRLEGDASFLFGPRKRVHAVDLSRNLLKFDLSKVRFSKRLTWLDLNHNLINGSLPVGLTALDFQSLNVSYNRLCGSIPVGGELQRFGYTAYFHNTCLCGSPLGSCQ